MLLLINNLPDLISSHSPTQVGLLVTPTGKKNIGQQPGPLNSKRKLSLAHDYHAHSVDGLHWSFYTHKNLAQGIEWVQSIKSQGRLFDNATLIQDH
jgi:hypothetical protein